MKPVVVLAALPLLALAAFAAAPAHAGGWDIDFNLIFGRRHCAPPPVVVERRVYVERPVCAERRVVVVERPACAPPPCHSHAVVVERPACARPPVVVVRENCHAERRVEYHESRRDFRPACHESRRFEDRRFGRHGH